MKKILVIFGGMDLNDYLRYMRSVHNTLDIRGIKYTSVWNGQVESSFKISANNVEVVFVPYSKRDSVVIQNYDDVFGFEHKSYRWLDYILEAEKENEE